MSNNSNTKSCMIYPMAPFPVTLSDPWPRFQGHGVIFKPIDAISVLCAQLMRDLLAIAKFLYLLVLIHNVWKSLLVWDGYSALFVWKLLLLCTCLRVNSEDASSGEAPVSKKRKLDPFAALRNAPDQRGSSFNSEEELSQHEAMQVAPASRSPRDFWKCQSTEFPILARVAGRVCCISASSAQSERDFSSIGNTVIDDRSRLSAKTVESIELVRWGLRGGFL